MFFKVTCNILLFTINEDYAFLKILMDDHTGERNPIDCALFGRNEISECIWFIQLPGKLQVVQCSRQIRRAEGASVHCCQRFLWIKVTYVTCMRVTNWITQISNDFGDAGHQQNAFTNDCHCVRKARTTTQIN